MASLATVPNAPLVDRAVEEIRSILTRTVSRGMEEVGAYLLKTFYDDDLELYHAHAPSKHASLRSLARRCGSLEMPVSASFLALAIRSSVVARSLPASARYRQLPVSHRMELLRLPEPARIEQVATQAVAERLSVRRLRERVRSLGGVAPRPTGRPRTPAVSKAVNAAANLLRARGTWELAFRPEEVAALDEAERRGLRETLRRVGQLVDRLRRAIDPP